MILVKLVFCVLLTAQATLADENENQVENSVETLVPTIPVPIVQNDKIEAGEVVDHDEQKDQPQEEEPAGEIKLKLKDSDLSAENHIIHDQEDDGYDTDIYDYEYTNPDYYYYYDNNVQDENKIMQDYYSYGGPPNYGPFFGPQGGGGGGGGGGKHKQKPNKDKDKGKDKNKGGGGGNYYGPGPGPGNFGPHPDYFQGGPPFQGGGYGPPDYFSQGGGGGGGKHKQKPNKDKDKGKDKNKKPGSGGGNYYGPGPGSFGPPPDYYQGGPPFQGGGYGPDYFSEIGDGEKHKQKPVKHKKNGLKDKNKKPAGGSGGGNYYGPGNYGNSPDYYQGSPPFHGGGSGYGVPDYPQGGNGGGGKEKWNKFKENFLGLFSNDKDKGQNSKEKGKDKNKKPVGGTRPIYGPETSGPWGPPSGPPPGPPPFYWY